VRIETVELLIDSCFVGKLSFPNAHQRKAAERYASP